ncbi:MAG: hypothetical protein JSU69_01290 [Candidatus Zixiibacteriota bacterium]|nr:MAG: hypothetical protein JSU69_01290 [candidate division Zixibacteria bacterium]
MKDSFFKGDDNQPGQSQIPSLDDSPGDSGSTSGLDKDRGVIAAVLSYIPFLCLVPLLQMRDNEQTRFHSKQGLLLFLVELLAVLFLIPGLSNLVWKIVIVLALGASAAGIIFGIQGKKYKLPLIGDIADKMRL